MHVIAGQRSEFSARLEAFLADAPPLGLRTLVNADVEPDAASVVQRCRHFADSPGSGRALVLTVLHAVPSGLDFFDRHAANAMLWAFTRQSALAWAPRGIRVNAIGLPAGVARPDEPGKAARQAPPPTDTPVSMEDVCKTIRAIACLTSMTGQMVRLGTGGRG